MKKYLLFAVTALIVTPTVALAQRYLVDLPIDTQGDFNQYINLLYKMSISIAALLAVVKIVIAGAKYMLSDVVTNKSDAKKDIQGALLGLLLILGAVIILNTVNPALTDGGLNITQLKRIATNEDALSPVAAAKQQGQELTADLPKCSSQVSSLNKDRNKKLTTVSVSECPTGERVGILTSFGNTCVAAGGTVASNGTDSNKVTCSVPLPTGKEYQGFTIADYSDIDKNFVTQEGNLRTVDVKGQCQKEVTDSGFTGGKNQQDVYDICVSETKNAVEEYCEDDNGGNYSETETSAKCVLPIRRAFISSLTKELEQYKATLSDTDFEGRNLDDANDSEKASMAVCKIWGGQYKNIDDSGLNQENICVDFDSDPTN